MKTFSHLRLLTILTVSTLFLGTPDASAQAAETVWTTKDGTTFWAQLGGWDGTHVILIARGRDFRVLGSRLSPKSVEKASLMLGLSEHRMSGAGTPAGPKSDQPAIPLMAASVPPER